VVETMDGGQTWHVLAKLPVQLDHHPWSHSFAYDPIGDVLYCNSRGHAGGPYLFGRLALKRWGDIEKTPPSAPAGIEASIARGGNSAALRWKPSSDASGIYAYYIYIDGTLQYRTEKPEIVLSNCAWKQELKVGVQAVDPWQNRSAVVEQTVRLGAKPAEVTLLQDLQPASATVDGAPMSLVTDAADDKSAPLTIRMDGYEPNPVPQHAPRKLSCGVGIRVKNTHKQGVLEYAVDQKFSRLVIDAGMRNSGWDRTQLRILLDGKEVAATKPTDYETAISGVGRKPESFDFDLTNVKKIRFEVSTIGDTRYWTDVRPLHRPAPRADSRLAGPAQEARSHPPHLELRGALGHPAAQHRRWHRPLFQVPPRPHRISRVRAARPQGLDRPARRHRLLRRRALHRLGEVHRPPHGRPGLQRLLLSARRRGHWCLRPHTHG